MILYGTKQVAEILEMPEWRVKNFAEGKAYGLPPTQKIGTGRGSRRLYDLIGLQRLAIASELLDVGFAPETVGHAVRVVPRTMLESWEKYLGFSADKVAKLPLLVWFQEKWSVMEAARVKELFESGFQHIGGRRFGGLFVLNFLRRIAWLDRRLMGEEGDLSISVNTSRAKPPRAD